jgi:hypothetical protein
MEPLIPFPAWGAGNVSPISPIFPHFYPVILNSLPNKLYYYFYDKENNNTHRDTLWEEKFAHVSFEIKNHKIEAHKNF